MVFGSRTCEHAQESMAFHSWYILVSAQVYKPYLLINKKRYAGLLYTNPDKPDKMDAKVRAPHAPEHPIYSGCA